MTTKDKIAATAREEGQRIKALTKEAVYSRAYLFPLKGIVYYLSHRSLWRPLQAKAVPALTMGIGIFTSFFVFTYLPQAAVLAIFNGPVAAITTALLVASEASTVFMTAAKASLIEGSLLDTFDGTLVSKSQTALLASQREVKSGSDPIARLGKMLTRPFNRFAPSSVIRYLLYLPLNLVPIVGPALFILAQGKRNGPFFHDRYFALKRMHNQQRDDFVEQHRGPYTGFGVVATLLETIPIAGLFFAFTNATGAALWAAELEMQQEANDGTAPHLRAKADKAQ